MIKETLYKDVQLNQVAKRLNVSVSSVRSIWNMYEQYVQDKIFEGCSVKFLNICYFRVDGQPVEYHETVAYVATEIANKLNISKNVAYRVLLSFEEYLIDDLRNFYSYCIRGILKIWLQKVEDGSYRVRSNKSTIYDGYDIRVVILSGFKRKVEIY